jgi:murein L,D-transpeptidase YafK
MPIRLPRTSTLLHAALIASALALTACTETTLDTAVKGGADAPLPPRIQKTMQTKGMSRESPIVARVFKEENVVEIWKQKKNGRYDLLASYQICKMSGKLGPKYIEGDRQSPEGFYTVRPGQMNPKSNYHLAFNIGYPNAYDRAHGRTGSNLMVHGACSSSGCFSMNDGQMTEIYAIARESFKGGQTDFQVQSFPFRMTAANMARYKDDPNYAFWTNLKEGYDYFEITKTPPKVDVCEKRYVFNADAGGAPFSAAGKCPAIAQPDSLKMAYQSYQSSYEAAFASAIGSGATTLVRKPSIGGLQEAKVVSDWTKKRARGERVPVEPPSLAADGSIVQTTSRMGRIDSPAGRKMAEKAAKLAAAELAKAPPPPPVTEEQVPVMAVQEAPEMAAQEAARPGVLSRVGKRFTSLFGS